MSNLPERVEHRAPVHPALYRATVSPTAVAATAVGAGIGVLDHSVILAVILGAVGWSGRMLAAVVGRRRRERAARPHPAQIDPWSVPEPWRQLLQQAAGAQARFQHSLAHWPPGPTRERLEALEPRLYAEVDQLGELAHRGAEAAGWTGAMYASGRPSDDQLSDELQQVQAERRRLTGAASNRSDELDRREAAIAAQLRANRRATEAGDDLQDRLRLAVARLDETVTELLALGGTATEPVGLSSGVDELNDGILSLRAALTEGAGPPSDPRTP